MNFLYDCSLILCLPWIFFKRFIKGRFRGNLLKRFGFGFPHIEKGNRKLIWLHAVSLGETKAISELAKHLAKEYLLIVSTMTETGYEEAKKNIPFAEAHVYLPFDLKWIIRPIIRRIEPDLVLISETDLWINFMTEAKSVGSKIVLVNGKLSKRSLKWHQRLLPITSRLWKLIDLYCVQSETYKERFEQIGVTKEKIVVTGNLKFDKPIKHLTEEQTVKWKERFGIKEGDLVIALGSTHDPEERILLTVLKKVWSSIPRLKVLLAPRRPERFDEVEKILHELEVKVSRLSELKAPEKMILIDQMGLLDSCYQIADLAIVGGSFTDVVGGHNILEPCAYGTPVLFGPFMHAQPDLAMMVEESGAGKQVDVSAFCLEVTNILKNKKELAQLGSSGLSLMEASRGATRRTLLSILSL